VVSHQRFVHSIKTAINKVTTAEANNIKHWIRRARTNGGRVFLFGNGGSAAIAQHIANDLFKRLEIPTLTPSSVPEITCLSNDYGYEELWMRFMSLHRVTKTDYVIFISSSGTSPNFTNACEEAWSQGLYYTTLAGFDGYHERKDRMKDIPDIVRGCPNINFDSHNYGVVEMATEVLLHGIIEEIIEEKKLER
jgi:D-sedoheptulose 7-phosphate isomerase